MYLDPYDKLGPCLRHAAPSLCLSLLIEQLPAATLTLQSVLLVLCFAALGVLIPLVFAVELLVFLGIMRFLHYFSNRKVVDRSTVKDFDYKPFYRSGIAVFLVRASNTATRECTRSPRFVAVAGTVPSTDWLTSAFSCCSLTQLSYTQVTQTVLHYLQCVKIGSKYEIVLTNPAIQCNTPECAWEVA